MRKVKTGVNDLYTWCLSDSEAGQKILSEWTGLRDDGNYFTPNDVAKSSSMKFKWKCDRGHEWYATVGSRTCGGTGCPYCSGHKVSNDNSLKNWCLNNGVYGQQIMSEWTGICEDGKQYDISNVARSSNRRFMWKCNNGHKWTVTVLGRTSRKCGCPHCYNNRRSEVTRKAMLDRKSKENNLLAWCLKNGSFGQKLMSEWTGICEDGRQYKMNEFARASQKKFKWKCSEGHEWSTTIYSRTMKKSGCPYCAGQRVSNENSLKTWCLRNSLYGKQLIKEWTGICDDGKHYSIDQVTKASNKKFKWICSKGHEWYAKINARTSQKTGCPYCSGQRVSTENSLKTWCLNNDEFGKQLISEWTGLCTDGKHYDIDQVTKASNRKFKWKCSSGHEWFAIVSSRTMDKTGCPCCYEENKGAIVAKARISEKNTLKTWCARNKWRGKQVLQQWTGDCDDDKHYEISDVAWNSEKVFKWRCYNGHEWHAKVIRLTVNEMVCPICKKIANRKMLIDIANSPTNMQYTNYQDSYLDEQELIEQYMDAYKDWLDSK